MEKIENKFNPKDFEDRIYKKWEEEGAFKPSMKKGAKPYSIVMPPPNITGKLHMGHALDGTIQDILIRAKRMQGYNTLYLPGTDHASIATEVKVVKKMKDEEGLTKADVTREEFLKRAWDWTYEYGSTIKKQQRKLGLSCDWSKERFTLDEGLSKAVVEQFVRLYEKGLIYKGKRMINWCPSCHTTISDAEVEYETEKSHLWHLRYKIIKNADEKDIPDYVEVATTRPETMLGDTAVAVNPKDKRYTNIVGRKAILPIVNREIPIIADDFVDMEFGTGCVKITPAHDPNDYQAGLKHNLDIIEVFDDSSIMGDIVPEYKGLTTIEAREKIVEKLKEIGALVSIEDYEHNVGKCYRCHSTIEPRISDQWFIKMKDLAKRAADEVRNGDVRIIPKKYESMYFNWLDNIQDWCISRQLWWGHRIPAYYCEKCGHINVSREAPTKCEKCGSDKLHQDEDTLDTWFSSALWPFSTMGWPDENAELYKTFYPTNVLVTGFDIITFWVSRMMTQGLELTGKKPFDDVLIHGLVRDSQGRKMSKSLGNGIDPLEVIDKYGADALRFSLISGITMGNDIKFMTEKLDQASNFANKIWNAAKFIIGNLESEEEIREFYNKVFNKDGSYNDKYLKLEDKWILNKFDKLVADVTRNIDNYDLGVALDKIYAFMWNEFCDWYIEMCKPRIYSENKETRIAVELVLDYVFEGCLKLLHPFMPFVTTEIYSKLIRFDGEKLISSKWPEVKTEFTFDKEENDVEKIKKLITEIRNVRSKMNVHPSKKSKLIIITNSENEKVIKEAEEFLLKLASASEITFENDEKVIPKNAISIVADDIKAFIPFEELVDLDEERKRLEAEKKKLEAEVERSNKILSNKGFLAKAPKEKVQEEEAKKVKYEAMLNETIARLSSIK